MVGEHARKTLDESFRNNPEKTAILGNIRGSSASAGMTLAFSHTDGGNSEHQHFPEFPQFVLQPMQKINLSQQNRHQHRNMGSPFLFMPSR